MNNMYEMVVGYMIGSDINIYDEAGGRRDEHEFQAILNEVIEYGARVIWESYKVFVIHGMVFASVLIDTTEMDDEWSFPVMDFGQNSTGFPNKERKQAVEAYKNRNKKQKNNSNITLYY